jgi:hypothetical protein
MKYLGKTIGAALALALAGVVGIAQAAMQEIPSLENFDSLSTGTYTSSFTNSNGYIFSTAFGDSMAIEQNGANKYLTSNYLNISGVSHEIGGFDIAVKTPTTVGGAPALSYLVLIEGFTLFPMAREVLISPPGTNGLSFAHIGRNDLGGDYGEDYGYIVGSPITITVWGCKVAGCDDYAKDVVIRSSGGTPFGDYDNYVRTDFAIDNMQLVAFAVPEPSTYAMLLGGLAAIGLVRRRRRA